ncbi:unnamed protein product [Prorocentrum cordatum]|uniref:Uncharacterized protein n=1 Tax=Prorocentrum cordatum TaxID=2364126 RepID=A0ABN9TTU9_9DINO|nr:unnamed protein product [Polarella glacialis]
MARLLAVAVVALSAAVAEAKVNATIPITETVTIDGAQIFGSSAGHSSLGQCSQFARDTVNDPARPSIEVCGTSTKVVVFLRNRCKDYFTYSHEIGTCNTGAPSSPPWPGVGREDARRSYYILTLVKGSLPRAGYTVLFATEEFLKMHKRRSRSSYRREASSSCVTGAPSTVAWMQTAQSYRIETC